MTREVFDSVLCEMVNHSVIVTHSSSSDRLLSDLVSVSLWISLSFSLYLSFQLQLPVSFSILVCPSGSERLLPVRVLVRLLLNEAKNDATSNNSSSLSVSVRLSVRPYVCACSVFFRYS